MKKLILIFVLSLITSVKAQEVYSFSEVVKVEDSQKQSKSLYASAKMWFTQSFKNPKEVIILDDSENTILVGRGNMPYKSKIFSGSAAREGYITFDVTIACKDGRYKYDITNFTHSGNTVNYGLITNEETLPTMTGLLAGGPKNYKIKVTNELKSSIDERIKPLIEHLKSSMEKPIATKEDW